MHCSMAVDDSGHCVLLCYVFVKGITQSRIVGVVGQVLIGYCRQHWYSPVQAEGPDSHSKLRWIYRSIFVID